MNDLKLEIRSPRISQLDGLRGLAILIVFVRHVFNVPLLWMGVDLFFVLSGFLITGILLRKKEAGGSYFGYFYARRAKRILPPYLMVLVITTLIFGFHWVKFWYWYVFFGTNFASALGQIEDNLQPLWSLAVEEQFYLIWPFVIFFLSERALVWVAASLLVITPVLRGLATPFLDAHSIYFLTPFRMDIICAGTLLALAWKNNRDLLQKLYLPSWFSGVAVIGSFFWLSRFPQFRTSSNTVAANVFIYSLIVILMSSIFIIALNGRGLLGRALDHPLIRYIGTISYSMYLVHFTVIILVKRIFGNILAGFLVSLGITLLYATLTWFGFEKRLTRK